MNHLTAEAIRGFVLSKLAPPLAERGLNPDRIPDDFDLLTEGVIDSLALIELIAAVERQFNLQLDFEDLDPQDLTIIGPLCRYIEARSQNNLESSYTEAC